MPQKPKSSTRTTTRSSVKKTAKTIRKPVKAPRKVKPVAKKAQTAEQIADISKASNSFEGSYRLDKLPFNEQMNQVFNPLHTITKTTVGDNITNSTFVVHPAAPVVEKEKAN